MDAQRFTDEKTGSLRRFTNPHLGKPDWLFLPDELPPRWGFPNRLWPLLADAKEALGTLNGIGQTLKNPDLLLRPLQNREAISSSSIEGTYVTPKQLLLYEMDPQEPRSATGEVADWREVFNYRRALLQGAQAILDNPILNRHLLAMHKTLMSDVRGATKSPGSYRRVQVQIGATGKYIPPPPSEVATLMANLERYINAEDVEIDPLVLSYIVHYQLEAIHPFADGNGRIGRVLLALMVYKFLGHSCPWLYMSDFFEQHKTEYTDRLFRVSTHGDWDGWIEFCLIGTIAQAKDAIRRCHRIGTLRDEFHNRVASAATSRSHSIIESLFELSPVMSITSLSAMQKVSYKTAQSDLERLTEAGILEELPNSRPRSFYAPELFSIAYGNEEEHEKENE